MSASFITVNSFFTLWSPRWRGQSNVKGSLPPSFLKKKVEMFINTVYLRYHNQLYNPFIYGMLLWMPHGENKAPALKLNVCILAHWLTLPISNSKRISLVHYSPLFFSLPLSPPSNMMILTRFVRLLLATVYLSSSIEIQIKLCNTSTTTLANKTVYKCKTDFKFLRKFIS